MFRFPWCEVFCQCISWIFLPATFMLTHRSNTWKIVFVEKTTTMIHDMVLCMVFYIFLFHMYRYYYTTEAHKITTPHVLPHSCINRQMSFSERCRLFLFLQMLFVVEQNLDLLFATDCGCYCGRYCGCYCGCCRGWYWCCHAPWRFHRRRHYE